MKQLQLLQFFTVGLLLASCSSDQEMLPISSNGAALSSINALTGGNKKDWQLTTFTNSGGDSILNACEKDDVYTFDIIGSKYLINRGSEKCSDNEKNLVTTFALSSNGKKITLEGYELAIDQLSEQKIQLSLGISGNLAKMVFTAK